MEAESCRFIILDFGHPMKTPSMQNIINSLENALMMSFACPRSMRETFGISILNTDLILFASRSSLRQNFESIFKTLKSSLTTSKKMTVQEFKYLLSRSLERILREFQNFTSYSTSNRPMNRIMQIAILSKKRASVLGEIIMDVTTKMQENFPISLVKSYKIIQILTKRDNTFSFSHKKASTDCTLCVDNIYDIGCFFKRWLMGQNQGLKILLSKELELELYCDADDCVVSPAKFIPDAKWDKMNDVGCVMRSPSKMEVVSRLPVACSLFKYFIGVPRSITPAQSLGLKMSESQMNTKIFKHLCQRLYKTGEALLAKSELANGSSPPPVIYHLLTSDGNILLMNDVATKELSLPPGGWAPTTGHSTVDQSVASKLEACLEKIQRVNEYDPRKYTSGAYEYRKAELEQLDTDSEDEEYEVDLRQSSERLSTKGEESQIDFISIVSSHYEEELSENGGSGPPAEPRKKKPPTTPKPEKTEKTEKTEKECLHPALISPVIVEKYRKIHAQAFNLPELSKDFGET